MKKPRCPYCGGLARQNVLMFDDWTYSSNYQDFKKLRLDAWLKEVKKGGFIRINPQDAGVPKMHFLSLEMTALAALKEIDELL